MKLGSDSSADFDAVGSFVSGGRAARPWANAAGVITPTISTNATRQPTLSTERPRHQIIGIALPSTARLQVARRTLFGKFAAKCAFDRCAWTDQLWTKDLGIGWVRRSQQPVWPPVCV